MVCGLYLAESRTFGKRCSLGLLHVLFVVCLCVIMPPTLKKLIGHIAFGACVRACVGGCVGACVRHTFCTYCNF